MVNGSPTYPYKMEKDLRQGDPVLSFLFSIMGESLSYVIQQEKTKGLITGVKIGNNEVELTHFEFADDTLIFIPEYNYMKLL